MGHAGQARGLGHLRHLEGARQPADVADVGLDDVDGLELHDAPPDGEVAVLLTPGHVQVEGVGDLLGPLDLPVRTRLLEMADPVVLQHAAHLDRLRGRVARVGVDQKRRLVAERLAHGGHHRLAAAGPFVLVVAAFLADPELEGPVARLVPEALQARGLVLGRDVPAHAGGVDGEGPRPAAQELADALALKLAAQVPEGGIEAGERPAQVGARELVLALGDQVHKAVDITGVVAERMGRHLAVQHQGRDVGVVGRDLAPAFGARLGPHPHQADELGAEGLEGLDLHGTEGPAQNTMTFLSASPRLTDAMASLIRSSG